MRSELREDLSTAAAAVSVEKQQELLLMNKLASGGRLPPKTQSSFLQKKLQQRVSEHDLEMVILSILLV